MSPDSKRAYVDHLRQRHQHLLAPKKRLFGSGSSICDGDHQAITSQSPPSGPSLSIMDATSDEEDLKIVDVTDQDQHEDVDDDYL